MITGHTGRQAWAGAPHPTGRTAARCRRAPAAARGRQEDGVAGRRTGDSAGVGELPRRHAVLPGQHLGVLRSLTRCLAQTGDLGDRLGVLAALGQGRGEGLGGCLSCSVRFGHLGMPPSLDHLGQGQLGGQCRLHRVEYLGVGCRIPERGVSLFDLPRHSGHQRLEALCPSRVRALHCRGPLLLESRQGVLNGGRAGAGGAEAAEGVRVHFPPPRTSSAEPRPDRRVLMFHPYGASAAPASAALGRD